LEVGEKMDGIWTRAWQLASAYIQDATVTSGGQQLVKRVRKQAGIAVF